MDLSNAGLSLARVFSRLTRYLLAVFSVIIMISRLLSFGVLNAAEYTPNKELIVEKRALQKHPIWVLWSCA